MGSVLFLAGRHDEAIDALDRASRWGTNDRPLYQGHLALAKCHAGMRVPGLAKVMRKLDACPAGQGYGRFVLGQLAVQADRLDEARRYLEAFVQTDQPRSGADADRAHRRARHGQGHAVGYHQQLMRWLTFGSPMIQA